MIIRRRKSEMTFSQHLHINHPVIRPAFHYRPPYDRCFPTRLWSITSSQLTWQRRLVRSWETRTWHNRWPSQWGCESTHADDALKIVPLDWSAKNYIYGLAANSSLLQGKENTLLHHLDRILVEWLFLILLRPLPTHTPGLFFSPILQAKMLTYLEQQPVRGTD